MTTLINLNQLDGLEIISLSETLQINLSEVKILSTNDLLNDIIFDETFNITIQKFPKWPYSINKRADHFFYKTFTNICKTKQYIVRNQIHKTDNGYTIYINNLEDMSESEQNNHVLQAFKSYNGSKCFPYGEWNQIYCVSNLPNVEMEDIC